MHGVWERLGVGYMSYIALETRFVSACPANLARRAGSASGTKTTRNSSGWESRVETLLLEAACLSDRAGR